MTGPLPPELRLWRDKKPEAYPNHESNPYLMIHYEYGRPVLHGEQAAACRGGWAAEFGRDAPLHVEIGPGNGFFLSGMAARHPEWNWLGLEIRFKRVMLTAKKLKSAGVEDNARVARYNAAALSDLFEPGEITALYVNHPDPWPRERHAKNRLLGPEFLDMVATLLAPGGEIRLKTDHAINVNALLENLAGRPFELLGRSDDVERLGTPWGEDVETNYQSKFRKKGEPVYAVQVVRQAR